MSRLYWVVHPLTIAVIVCATVAIASPLSSSKLSSLVALVPTTESDQLTCFASNSDIDGRGVRASTYAQSFLLFFTTLLCIAGGHLDSRERKALEKSYTNLLITACALLISAFVEAVAHRLSVYHALLVLGWSWMLTLNALLLSILPTIDGQIETEWVKWFQSALPSRIGQIPAMTFVSLHMSLMGIFGIYVWSKPGRLWGPDTQASEMCLGNTIMYIFFARFRLSNPTLRLVSIVCYSIVAIPFVNVFLLTATAVVIVNGVNELIPRPYTFGRLYRVTWGVQTVMNIFIAINTELTIVNNNSLIAKGESTWGFGQILAVVLIFSPFFEALSVIKDKLRGSSRGRVSYQFQRFLRKSEEPWDNIFRQETKEIKRIIALLRSLAKEIDPSALRAILCALESAREFFDATNTILNSSPSPRARTPDSEHEQHPLDVLNPPGALEANQIAPADGNQVGQSSATVADTTPPVGTENLPGQSTAADDTPAEEHLQGQPGASNTSLATPDGAPAHENQPCWKKLVRTHRTPASRLQTAKRDIVYLWERMSKTGEVRFPVSSADSFLKAKAYLRATEEALGVAIIALEPLT